MKKIIIFLMLFLFVACKENDIKQKSENIGNVEASAIEEVKIPKDLYYKCPFKNNPCPNESCIEQGIKRRIYNVWKKFIDQETLEKHLKIIDVEFSVVPEEPETQYRWSVAYEFQNDWLRTYGISNIAFPTLENLTDQQIIEEIDRSGRLRQYGSQIIPRSKLESLMKEKYNNVPLTYDFCHLIIGDGVYIRGKGYINSKHSNECVEGMIDIVGGTVGFSETPCRIN